MVYDIQYDRPTDRHHVFPIWQPDIHIRCARHLGILEESTHMLKR
jgi:hypothetical protein